ncbi:NAD(P)-dependent oxidoreductase [Pseudonocardia ailaonensis]|uniref:NAD(P)-dependent oxidoreductase n=1 Tax=Pseudonocardia ailaonensis TaxID=367279 RepID=A0ABN2NJX3_9PSEU
MRIGFIGVGDLGGAMALMIARAGLDVTVWARRSTSLDQFAGTSVGIAQSARALGAGVDVLCLCVFSAADIESVLFDQGAADGLRPGSTVVVHSTIGPPACERIARRLAGSGIDTLDAPIGGGPRHARAQLLTVMAGGEAAVLDRVRPVFGAYARSVHHLGGIGAGQRTKVVNNITHLVNIDNALRALAVAEDGGIDREEARSVFLHSSAASFAIDETVPRLGDAPGHFVDLMRKELDAFRRMTDADTPGAPELGAAAEEALRHLERRAAEQGEPA